MGGVDEARERLGAAVGRLRRAQVDAVVAPAARARELGDRHQLDGGDAELGERRQVRDRAVERALGGERADVQLVEHLRAERGGVERLVGPRERGRVDHARRPAQAVGLPARRRVGQRVAVEHELVVARRRVRARVDPVALVGQLEVGAVRRAATARAFGAQTRNSTRPSPAGRAPSGCSQRVLSRHPARARRRRAAAASPRPRTAGSSRASARPRRRRGCRRRRRRSSSSRC